MLISQRTKTGGPGGHLAFAAWYEAEDVLAEAGGLVIQPIGTHSEQLAVRARRVVGRGLRRALGPDQLLPPSLTGPSVTGHGHLFFLAHSVWDLCQLEQLRSLRRSAATVSVWIPEIWPRDLRNPKIRHECYSMIDHVFVGIEQAVEPFADFAPNVDVHVLPPAADVLQFAPSDPLRPRGISVLGIGRRDVEQHRRILEWADIRQALYVYDTVQGRAIDWAEHRAALARQYQHTNVAVCNYAKHDSPTITEGLRVLPGRLFEGLAAGAVLVGIPPDEDLQHRVLGQTVVEPLDGSGRGVGAVLDRFADPGEAEPVRIRNLALACRSHDWSHRWRDAMHRVGLPIPFGLRNRIDDLAKMADYYEGLLVGSNQAAAEPVVRPGIPVRGGLPLSTG